MSTESTASSVSSTQLEYMNLLVTQLQNQNPLEPMDGTDMTAQLAQFSQLEMLDSMNTSFSKVLDSVQSSYASSLIGKEVSFYAKAADGASELETGQVEEVVLGDEGEVTLVVDGEKVSLAAVVSIRE